MHGVAAPRQHNGIFSLINVVRKLLLRSDIAAAETTDDTAADADVEQPRSAVVSVLDAEFGGHVPQSVVRAAIVH